MSETMERAKIAATICEKMDDSVVRTGPYPLHSSMSECACWGAADAILALTASPSPQGGVSMIDLELVHVAEAALASPSLEGRSAPSSSAPALGGVAVDPSQLSDGDLIRCLEEMRRRDTDALAFRDAVELAPSPLRQEQEGWRTIEREPPPKDEMFIWAAPKGDGKYSLGLAYHNVSGGWSDAYGNDAPDRATHWMPLPATPAPEPQGNAAIVAEQEAKP